MPDALRSIVAGVIAIGLTSSVAAQAPAPGDADAKAAALLASLKDIDPGLLGTQKFDLIMPDEENVGSMTLAVERASSASGAGYFVERSLDLADDPVSWKISETYLLEPQLSLHSGRTRNLIKTSGRDDDQRCEYSRRDGEWTYTVIDRFGGPPPTKLKDAGPIHSELCSLFLLARRLDLSAPASIRLRSVQWEGGAHEDAEGMYVGGAAYGAMDITVAAVAPFQHRGEEVAASLVKFAEESGGVTLMQVSPEDGVLAVWWEKGLPYRIVADGNGVAAATPEDQETAGPRSAVQLYQMVLAKAQPVDALDKVMDWKAIKKDLGSVDKEIKSAKEKAFIEKFKATIAAAAPARSVLDAELAGRQLKVEIDGKKATVSTPEFADDPFTLRLDGDAWLITHFPPPQAK